jgi:hypothetical protein
LRDVCARVMLVEGVDVRGALERGLSRDRERRVLEF